MDVVEKEVHPVGFSVKMGLRQLIDGVPQDATEDYPQSGRVFQVVRVRKGEMGGGGGAADDRNRDRGPP